MKEKQMNKKDIKDKVEQYPLHNLFCNKKTIYQLIF